MATRAEAEQETVSRLSGFMSAVGMAVTYAGSNSDLNSPIGWAVRTAGGTVGDISNVTDADVATVSSAKLDDFLDLVELRTIESCMGRNVLVDISASAHRQSLGQIGDRMASRAEALRRSLGKYLAGNITAGSVFHDYIQDLGVE